MSLLQCWLRSHEPLRKKASSRDCFILILCAFWPAGILSAFVLHAPYSFFSVSFEAQSVFSLLHKKRESSRLQPSGLPNWTASHFSFKPLYVDQGSHTELSVAREHQGYLFCLVECKVNRRNCKIARTTPMSMNSVSDRQKVGAAVAACG